MNLATAGPEWGRAGISALIATLLVGAWFVLFGSYGIDLRDEGFLWYGAVRTGLGEVPLRDFQAYEPGRYYWIAALTWLAGPGIMALRFAVAVFFALGLTCGLQVIARVQTHPLWRVAVGLLLVAWAFPRHKLFEPALAMFAVWVGVRLAEQPSWRRHLQAGACVGIAACFGKNHALYSGLGLGCILLWVHWKRSDLPWMPTMTAFSLGGLLGALPLLGMMAFVPGFVESFVETTLFFLRHGSNHPIDIPWPWLVLGGAYGGDNFIPMAVGLVFLLGVITIALGLGLAWRGDPDRAEVRVVVAATLVGLFYAHHAAVRSDVFHLAQCIPPLLLAAWTFPLVAFQQASQRGAAWFLIGALTLGVTSSNELVAYRLADDLGEYPIGGDSLWVPVETGRGIAGFEKMLKERVPESEPLLIAPYTPGLYAIFDRKAPVWGLYMLWEAGPEEQQGMIRDLASGHVNWALIWDVTLSSPRRSFRSSYPLVWAHLLSDFTPIRDPRLPQSYLLFQRNGPESDPAR